MYKYISILKNYRRYCRVGDTIVKFPLTSQDLVSSIHSIERNGLNLQGFIGHHFKKFLSLSDKIVSSGSWDHTLHFFVCFFFVCFIFKTLFPQGQGTASYGLSSGGENIK